MISVDEASEGEDGGKIRVMDPDQAGRDAARGHELDASEARAARVRPDQFGAEGGSYGGMYQFMLLNIDKRHRLRAIVPQITPADLNFSLFQGRAVKTLWDAELFAIGQSAGNGTSRAVRSLGRVQWRRGNDAESSPTTTPPKINNGYANQSCMQRGGSDVRLLSYQTGHNALETVPDSYVSVFYPSGDRNDSKCGKIDEATAELAWFDEYLKKARAAPASFITTQPCISFSAGDGITVPAVPTYSSGPGLTACPVSATVVAGVTPDAGRERATAERRAALDCGPERRCRGGHSARRPRRRTRRWRDRESIQKGVSFRDSADIRLRRRALAPYTPSTEAAARPRRKRVLPKLNYDRDIMVHGRMNLLSAIMGPWIMDGSLPRVKTSSRLLPIHSYGFARGLLPCRKRCVVPCLATSSRAWLE